MKAPDSVAITADLRQAANALIGRLGSVRVKAEPSWLRLWQRLDLASSQIDLSPDDGAFSVVVVGPPATVLKHAVEAQSEFGFMMPVAQIVKPWQRDTAWRDDATLDLWSAGWTPVDIDRILVGAEEVMLEFVIGNARPTPPGVEPAA